VRDAEGFPNLLTDTAYCGYSAANVHLLLDDQCTNAAFRDHLAARAERTTAGSTVFLSPCQSLNGTKGAVSKDERSFRYGI
jgi:hypothetical protein